MSSEGKTLSMQEAASIIGVERRTVQQWVKEGKLKSFKTAENRRRILRSSIEELQRNARPSSRRCNLDGRYVHGFRVPVGFDVITTYKELAEYTAAFADGGITFLLLVGSPGSGKTKQMKNELAGHDHRWIDNHTTELGLYCTAYKANHTPIVLDDVNHFLKKPIACSLMKALTQTEQRRSVSWESTASTLDKFKVPRQFTTTSRICLIGNQWDGTNPDMAAIQDRSLPVAFFPSAETIHERVREQGWCVGEVWKFIGEHLSEIPQPSMREYHNGMTYLKAKMNWRMKLLKLWGVQ